MDCTVLLSPVGVLHGGHGQEVALVEYAVRVLLSLIAVGGVAAVVYWWMDAIGAARSAPANGDGESPTPERGRRP